MPTPRPDITTVARPSPIRRTQTWLTIALLAIALVWFFFNSVRGNQAAYDPGSLNTPKHIEIENECWRCHDGGKNGPLSLKVSDTACLSCHDGDACLHSKNQKLDDPQFHKPLAAEFQFDPQKPKITMSANCTSCHVEHHSKKSLMDPGGDATCIQCHDKVQDHATNPIVVQSSVTEFAKDKHPDFGRQLLKGGKFIDPTVLKFNHQFHTQQGVSKDCTVCHKAAADGKYMLPVNYQASCESCHPLNVLAGALGVKIKHQDLVKVRQEIDRLPAIYLDRITTTANSKELRYKGTLPTIPVKKTAALAKAKEGVDLYSFEEYTQRQLTAFSDQLNKLNPTYPQLQHLRDVTGTKPEAFSSTVKSPTTTTTLQAPNRNLLEYYIVFQANNRCVLCHDVSGELPAVVASKQSAGQGPATLLSTAPTNVPAMLFTDSKFDHKSHGLKTANPTPEQMEKSCMACHDNVYNSIVNCVANPKDAATKKTNPILWDSQQLEETSRLLTPTAITSCTGCHNPPGSAGHSASSSCLTCHDYHDRRLEIHPVVTLSAASP